VTVTVATYRRPYRPNMQHRSRSRSHKTGHLMMPSPLINPPIGEWKQRHARKTPRTFCVALKALRLLQQTGNGLADRVEVYPCTWGDDAVDGPRAETRRHWHLGRGRVA